MHGEVPFGQSAPDPHVNRKGFELFQREDGDAVRDFRPDTVTVHEPGLGFGIGQSYQFVQIQLAPANSLSGGYDVGSAKSQAEFPQKSLASGRQPFRGWESAADFTIEFQGFAQAIGHGLHVLVDTRDV